MRAYARARVHSVPHSLDEPVRGSANLEDVVRGGQVDRVGRCSQRPRHAGVPVGRPSRYGRYLRISRAVTDVIHG